jgi:hypothetical protein
VWFLGVSYRNILMFMVADLEQKRGNTFEQHHPHGFEPTHYNAQTSQTADVNPRLQNSKWSIGELSLLESDFLVQSSHSTSALAQ